MFLYYMLLRGWLGLTGAAGIVPSEAVLRVPSAIFAVAASAATYELGRRLFGRVAGLVAVGLYSVNFLEMIVAQNARAYGVKLFLLALSWLALFVAVDDNRGRW
jgi:uncharacterized membrane protein